jgi:hypothetical protein
MAGAVQIAPTVRPGPIPPTPFVVAAGANLTVFWSLYVGTEPPAEVNVTGVTVSSSFELTSAFASIYSWHDVRGRGVFEEITLLAPTTTGEYTAVVTLTMAAAVS